MIHRFALFFVALSFSVLSQAQWGPQASAFISPQDCKSGFSHGKFIDVDLDKASSEKMQVFYFTLAPFNPQLPSLIYIDGGPGQAIGAGVDLLRFKNSPDMNIVFFHPRGSGCSQLPLDKKYDKYIRTRLLLTDMEAIRESLNVKKWDFVFGLSYGTVAALKYGELYPQAVSQIILEGLFNPQYPRNPNVLGYTKGLPTLYKIFSQWPEYEALDEAQRVFILQGIMDFTAKNAIVDSAGVNLTPEKLQTLFTSLFQLAYSGVHSPGSMNENLVYSQISAIVSVFYPADVVAKLPKAIYDAENAFPYLSMRVFYNIMIYDTLDIDFFGVYSTPNTTLEQAIATRFGPDLAALIGMDKEQPLTMLQLPTQLDKSIKLTLLLGTDDAATPFEGAAEYLKTLTADYDLYGLTGFAHQRHFSDSCYSQIFWKLLKKEKINDMLLNKNSECYLPEGYVGLP